MTSFQNELKEPYLTIYRDKLLEQLKEEPPQSLFDQWILVNLSLSIRKGIYRNIAKWLEDKVLNEQLKNMIEESILQGYIYKELGKLARLIHRYEDSGIYYNLAISVFHNQNNAKEIISCEMNKSNLLMSQGLFSAALAKYNQILENNAIGELAPIVLLNRASCMYQIGDVEGANSQYLELVDVFAKIKDFKRLAQTFLNVAVINLNKGDHKAALALFQNANLNYEKVENLRGRILATEYMAKILMSMGEFEKTLEILSSVLPDISWEEDYRLFARIATQYIIVQQELGADEEIVETMDPFFDSFSISDNEPAETYQMLYALVQSYLKLNKNLERVEVVIDNFEKIAILKDDLESLLEIRTDKLKLYSKMDNMSEGIKMIDKLIHMHKKEKALTKGRKKQIILDILLFYLKHFDILIDQYSSITDEIIKFINSLDKYSWDKIDERMHSTAIGFLFIKLTPVTKITGMIDKMWASIYYDLKNILLPSSHKIILNLILSELRKFSDKLDSTLPQDLELESMITKTSLGEDFKSNYKLLTWDIFEKLITELQSE